MQLQLYRASLRLQSSLVTALKGDTIWGHIVWGIANHEGDDKVAEFLEKEKSVEPVLIVSSAFPKGTICKPFPKHEPRKLRMSAKDYSQIKKDKKQKFVSAKEYLTDSENCDEKFRTETAQIMHNSINRFSGTVEEGNLFATEEMWFSQQKFDLYILGQ